MNTSFAYSQIYQARDNRNEWMKAYYQLEKNRNEWVEASNSRDKIINKKNQTIKDLNNRIQGLEQNLSRANENCRLSNSEALKFSTATGRFMGILNVVNGVTDGEPGTIENGVRQIFTLKAENMNLTAMKENWTTEKRREMNLKLAAEAEFDRKNLIDPKYRLKASADTLMSIAECSENADELRALAAKMYATVEPLSPDSRERVINARIAELKAAAVYEDDNALLPNPDLLPPAHLERDENNPEEYESHNIIKDRWDVQMWVAHYPPFDEEGKLVNYGKSPGQPGYKSLY